MKKTFSHGIHPHDAKDATRDLPIRRFPFAPSLLMLLSQHAGKPSKAIVHQGQEVERGQIIAEADGFMSVPMHSPASGVVKVVGSVMNMDGRMSPAIVIEPFPGSTQSARTGSPRSIDEMSAAEIIKGIQDMGMVGLGGAAFPTHVKFTPPKGKTVHALIVNGCECEPYLTSDHRVMLEQSDLVVTGIKLALKALGAKRAVIAIEDNKPDAIEKMHKAAQGTPGIEVQACVTKYPQGAEKMLTSAVLGKEIPSGGLPADIGVMVSNVATLAEIGLLLPIGQGLIERVITVTGSGVNKPGNYLIPLGTPLNFVLDTVGVAHNACEVVFGGPMMGKAVSFLETPITKGVSGIMVMTNEDLGKKEEQREIYPCIKCSQCLDACPIHLNPSRLGILARMNDFDRMAGQYHLFDCFECGCCSYVCPSNIPLVQYFRLAKQIVRDRRAAA